MLGGCSPSHTPPHPARALLMGRTAGRSLQGGALSPALSERRPLPGGAALFCPRQSPGGSVSPGVQARKSCLLCPRWPPLLASGALAGFLSLRDVRAQAVGGGRLWGGPHLFSPGAALRATCGPSLLRGGPVTSSSEPGSSEKGARRARHLPLSLRRRPLGLRALGGRSTEL